MEKRNKDDKDRFDKKLGEQAEDYEYRMKEESDNLNGEIEALEDELEDLRVSNQETIVDL